MQHPLFLTAVLPAPDIQLEVTVFKQECSHLFQASHALKSPPHITLQSPFRWPLDRLEEMKNTLLDFAQGQPFFTIYLDGFNCFKPRVIFVDVLPNEPLQVLKKSLDNYSFQKIGLKNRERQSFHPHLTIAHRDLLERDFPAAWAHFSKKVYKRQFLVKDIVLLQHMDRKWVVVERLDFG